MRNKIDLNEMNIETIQNSVLFWETVKKIESVLGVKFSPSAEVPLEDVRFLAELDACLLNDKTVVSSHPFDHFHINGVHGDIDKILNKNGASFDFLEGPIDCTFMGVEFILYSITKLSGFVMTSIEWDDERKESGEVYIRDENRNTPWVLKRKLITVEEREKIVKESKEE